MKAGKGREQHAAQALCGEVVTRRVAEYWYGVTRRVTDTYAAPGLRLVPAEQRGRVRVVLELIDGRRLETVRGVTGPGSRRDTTRTCPRPG